MVRTMFPAGSPPLAAGLVGAHQQRVMARPVVLAPAKRGVSGASSSAATESSSASTGQANRQARRTNFTDTTPSPEPGAATATTEEGEEAGISTSTDDDEELTNTKRRRTRRTVGMPDAAARSSPWEEAKGRGSSSGQSPSSGTLCLMGAARQWELLASRRPWTTGMRREWLQDPPAFGILFQRWLARRVLKISTLRKICCCCCCCCQACKVCNTAFGS